MFEFIRNHLKLVMIIFFPLVIIAFVFVGVDASMLTQRSPTVATVNGQNITQAQWDTVHRQRADQARANNPTLTSAFLDSPAQKYVVLEQMVREEVYRAAMLDKHYLVSDAQLARALSADPDIASLRKPDGSLDMDAYRQFVAARYRMTPEGFENSLRYQLSMEQVIGAVQEASFVTPSQSAPSVNAQTQTREIQTAVFAPSDFEGQVNPTDEQLQAFYQQNSNLFRLPEQVDVDYVVLDLDSVAKTIDVTDTELRQYYESNKQTYARNAEERAARHILINASESMPASEREAAKQKAEELLAQVRANPDQFAEIARKHSQDTGSASQGGDLGFFGRGAMVPPFEEAAFKLNKGEISDVVQSDFGYHIIQLTDLKAADIPAFDDVQERVAQDVKNSLARNRFIEAADSMRNLAHEQPDSLDPLVKELKLTVRNAQGVPQEGNTADNTPAELNSPQLLAELFSPKLLEEKYNSDAIDVGNNRIVVARVAQHHPARTQALDEVKGRVRTQLITQEATQLAKAAGEKALQAWKADANAQTTLGKAETVSRSAPGNLPAAVMGSIMQVPEDKMPELQGFDQGSMGYLIVKVNKIVAPEQGPDAETAKAFASMQYAQQLALAEASAYYETLKQQYKAQIRVPRPE